MKYGTFKRLATDFYPYIIAAMGRTGTPRYYVRNGQITPDVRLACALCWFTGGSAILLPHTVLVTQTQ
jgi:hypothetical protein